MGKIVPKKKGKKLETHPNVAIQKVQHWFFSYPTQDFTLTELCKAVKISKSTGKQVVEVLVKIGFLEKIVLGNLWRIRAKQDHYFFVTRKIPFNLTLIYESGILEAINQQIPNSRAIILFGSYRKGDDTAESDIDIAVEVLGDQQLQVVEWTLKEFSYRKDIKVNLHIFSRNHIDLNLFTNIANGILLQGVLEVRI